MLVNVDRYIRHSWIVDALSGGNKPVELHKGMYLINHFNFNHLIEEIIDQSFPGGQFPELGPHGPNCYGVCDTPMQLVQQYPNIIKDSRYYVASFTRVRKDEQESPGGWRWHKWGPYIGTQTPTCEYIADEPEIEEIYVYHIYEVMVE